ncbi:small ribosomal subunit protein eS27-like [Pongo pygmaeus]|uniref:small ribosomal subunit protein eS27-like n=1 Tax=Pongo pygmaeus TaxID=9600 RepID=UPI00300C9D76
MAKDHGDFIASWAFHIHEVGIEALHQAFLLVFPLLFWRGMKEILCERHVLVWDLLHPSPEEEKRKHKKKRLVQSLNSYFMDVKCPGCYKITTVFSHAQMVVLCVGCSTVLCQPTGGKARLTEGCSFRRKQH